MSYTGYRSCVSRAAPHRAEASGPAWAPIPIDRCSAARIGSPRVGYLVELDGFGLRGTLAKDIEVYTPFKGTMTYPPLKQIQVVGVLDSLSWAGGAGDPICISAYLSNENAARIRAIQQATLRDTWITKLAFWIINFDEDEKAWFEEAHPAGAGVMSGQLNAPGKTDIRLSVAEAPERVAPNMDVPVYNVALEVIPGGDKSYEIAGATSKHRKFVNGWGLKVGSGATT